MLVRVGKDDVVGRRNIELLDGDVFGSLAEAVLGLEEVLARENRVPVKRIEVAQLDFAPVC